MDILSFPCNYPHHARILLFVHSLKNKYQIGIYICVVRIGIVTIFTYHFLLKIAKLITKIIIR